ncbi:unannotated protein [freshwater metagenome]|uniref:Unannotated protein n=1 Tax=freshwater metagenome TaxID=449393 RepID=A0A6J7C6P0_9ZZZZ
MRAHEKCSNRGDALGRGAARLGRGVVGVFALDVDIPGLPFTGLVVEREVNRDRGRQRACHGEGLAHVGVDGRRIVRPDHWHTGRTEHGVVVDVLRPTALNFGDIAEKED